MKHRRRTALLLAGVMALSAIALTLSIGYSWAVALWHY
jgi:hypothetical protein